MSETHDNVDHTFEAVARLRGLLREHELSGARDTPFFIGIRRALEELDAYGERERQSAA